MIKKFYSLISILVIAIASLNASVNIFTTLNLEYSYDSNVFSSPLPIYDDGPDYNWLKWRQSNPYIKKNSVGFNVSTDCYFSDLGRVGISAGISVKVPFSASSLIPTPENEKLGFSGQWEYVEENITQIQKIAVFGFLGPTFRAQLGWCDLGLALRLSLGGYDYIQNEVILGLQAEPYFNIYMNQLMYLSIRFTYDAHLIRFINDDISIYDKFYQMLTLAPSIGLGIKF